MKKDKIYLGYAKTCYRLLLFDGGISFQNRMCSCKTEQ